MSETKFTPGPWKIDRKLVIAQIRSGSNHFMFVATTDHSRLDSIPQETFDANSALIAAAPDMYAALEHALSDMDTIDELCKIARVHRFTAAMRAEIKTVLIKARGES